jgi:CRP/FNR family cyclic AMP-dependent transcriptional regulator
MDPDAIADHISFFQGVPPDTCAKILPLGEVKTFPAQTVMIDPEAWGRDVVFIVSGWVKISTCIEKQEQTLDIFGQGDYLGTMAIFDDYPPLHQAIALAPTQILSVSAQRFLQLLLKEPPLQQRLLQLTNQRIRHLYRRLKSAHQSDARRIMKTLVYLGENYGATTDRGIELVAIPPQTLAEMVNCDVKAVEDTFAVLQDHQLLETLTDEGCYYLPYLKKLHHFSKQF